MANPEEKTIVERIWTNFQDDTKDHIMANPEEKTIVERIWTNFQDDTKDHIIEILKDDDVYKHIRFGEPNSYILSCNIVTTPGHLFYYGDMGSFCFARNKYMLGFFANDNGINPHYWMEKIIASSEPAEQLTRKEIEKSLLEHLQSHFECYEEDLYDDDMDRLDGDAYEELLEEKRKAKVQEVFDDVMNSVYFEGESDYWLSKAIGDIMEYKNPEHPELEFHGFYEYGCKEYTYRYIWCCFALNHVANYYFANIYKEDAQVL